MRATIGLLLAMAAATAACDRQSGQPPQAARETGAPAPAAAPPVAPEPAGTLDMSKRGKPMPSTRFAAPDGSTVTLAAFKGKPLLVNLWATWCGPCVAEMPTLDRLAVREAQRLQVLVISQDTQGREAVGPWWAHRSFRMLQPYLDPKADLGFEMASGMLPTTVLYDAEGKEVWRIVGGMDWDGPRANTLLAETLGAQGG